MSHRDTQLNEMLQNQQFPLSAKYDPRWIMENEMGPHVLWLTESLCGVVTIEENSRVLDLGCGKALSSIFLAKEFNAQIWATDLWIGASENSRRIEEAGVGGQVFPLRPLMHPGVAKQ